MSTRPSDDELAFERALLGAGRAEALPVERTASALLRFSAGMAAVQGALMVGPTLLSTSVATRLAAIAKWVVLGGVTGSALTFAWLRHAAPAVPTVVPAVPSAAVAVGASSAMRVLPGAVSAATASASGANAARPARAPARGASTAVRASGATSDLAAEVAALDAVRTALSIGAWREAEQLIARYRAVHPRGALRSEAEVLAVEALVAQGRKDEAALSASRFTAEHPRDPQAARIRALVK